jgi:beta-galactosidase
MNSYLTRVPAAVAVALFLEIGWSASPNERPAFAPGKMDTVLYGAAYYPEYMPCERLDKDVDLMQRAGINLVRVGESTWSSWEPREGQFEFAWMERVLDRLHQAGIRAILGTPTYSIPAWLYRKYPDIVVVHNGTPPPLQNPYEPTYPPALTPGYYGPRQNYDFLNPHFRQYAERIIREIAGHFKNHPAVIGYQIDNETFPTGVATPYSTAAFLERLKKKYGTPAALNRVWGLVYWGQLLDCWEELPPRDGIVNPGYKLEWENFQHDIVTGYLAWQARIVNEYKRPDQFITHDFSGGIHANLDQWAIARSLDIAGANVYYRTQKQFDARDLWLQDDLARSLKGTNYLVLETNAQTIGWDSRVQYPPYPGQLRQAVFAHLAAGANGVEYWHWGSLHYGQETFWKGILSHDLEPGRIYAEMARVSGELNRIGRDLVNLRKDNQVAILFSADSANAIGYMPFSDTAGYMTVLNQIYNALYDLDVEPDFVDAAETADLSRYKVVLVPPLYSASDRALLHLSDYVKAGGHVVMSFKSGFADEHSTVRAAVAPGPLRAAAGFHYREFTSLAETVPLKPDPYRVGAANSGAVWEEFLAPDTAEAIASFDDPYWNFPAITRNKYGAGTLTYEGTLLSDPLQGEVIRDVLDRAGVARTGPKLPAAIRARHGRNSSGKVLHYYFNFSGRPQSFSYAGKSGSDLLTGRPAEPGAAVDLRPWDLAIIAER